MFTLDTTTTRRDDRGDTKLKARMIERLLGVRRVRVLGTFAAAGEMSNTQELSRGNGTVVALMNSSSQSVAGSRAIVFWLRRY